jgi:hypothetical protein
MSLAKFFLFSMQHNVSVPETANTLKNASSCLNWITCVHKMPSWGTPLNKPVPVWTEGHKLLKSVSEGFVAM